MDKVKFFKKLPASTGNSRFSQIHNIRNNGNIAIYVFPFFFRFLLYSNCIVVLNAIIFINGHQRTTFQGWFLWWSSKFKIPHLKHKWQYCHSCIAGVCENLD